MLLCLGFPELFVGWVLKCVTTVLYSILVNGEPSSPFKDRKGLRQGDPMCPYLLSFSMEYLSRRLALLKDNKTFGFHPKCKRTNIVSILYADDLIIFCKGEVSSLQLVKKEMEEFSWLLVYVIMPINQQSTLLV